MLRGSVRLWLTRLCLIFKIESYDKMIKIRNYKDLHSPMTGKLRDMGLNLNDFFVQRTVRCCYFEEY